MAQDAETKIEELRKNLRKLAYEKGPGAKLPPVRELCDTFTTSRVMLREAMASLLADDTLYSKAREGIFVSPKLHYKSIAVLFDASIFSLRGLSPFWGILWILFTQEAQRRRQFREETCSFHHIIPDTDIFHSLPDPMIKLFLEQRIHGVLAIGLGTPSQDWLLQQAIPCVSFAASGHWIVRLHITELVKRATHALVAQGCRRIGLWQTMDRHNEPYNLEHYETYHWMKNVLQETHTPFYPTLSHIPQTGATTALSRQTITYQEQGYRLAREVFSQPRTDWPDGLIFNDDMLTDGALLAFQHMGIQIGKDVKIATQANVDSPILFGRSHELTMFEFDALELVQTMFSLLDILMSGQRPATRVVNIMPRLRQ